MTTSFIVFLVLVPIGLLAGVALSWVFLRAARKADDIDRGLFRAIGIAAAVLTLIGAVGATIGAYPWSLPYHSWHVREGTVNTVSSRLLSAGDSGGTDQKFVVTFKGNPQAYGVNDTRASTLKPGDHLRITCLRVHQWGAGVDGYDCRWDQ